MFFKEKKDLINVDFGIDNLFLRLSNDADFNIHPRVTLESNFTPFGNDIEKNKQNKKFIKRMDLLSKELEELYLSRINILNIISEFYIYFNIIVNDVGYYKIVSLYSDLSKSILFYNKLIKKYKNIPEIQECNNKFIFLLEVNVFDLMKSDLIILEKIVEKRFNKMCIESPNFENRKNTDFKVDFEKLLPVFKKK